MKTLLIAIFLFVCMGCASSESTGLPPPGSDGTTPPNGTIPPTNGGSITPPSIPAKAVATTTGGYVTFSKVESFEVTD
ncbi:MAG: hypothetical protein HC883_02850, partial [Bdellovibrionaceae bacterium]|nr:hypothetical protein [Pseudobdellovibrionaceae bacterium]